jgi:hypothetical protein
MLFLPRGGLPPKKNKMGYARGSGASGHWLRARAAVVNTNTDGMSRWRHLFNVAKVNFKATQPGGRNTAPVLGITPYEAWFYQSATYLGILVPGLFEGDLQLMQTMTGCSSVEAYEVMVSTILAQMGLTTPIAPPITTVKAAASGSTVTATAGTATLAVSPGANAQVGPISAVFSAALTISGFTMPAVPTPPGTAWTTSQSVINQFAMLPNSTAYGNLILPWAPLVDPAPGNYAFTVTGLPSGVTCSLDGIPIGGNRWLGWPMAGQFSVSATADALPGTYQASFQSVGPSGTATYNFVVTILDPAAYTTALDFSGLPPNVTAAICGYADYPLNGPFPATLEGLPNGTNTTFALSYNPGASTLTGQLVFLVTIDPSTPTGTYSFSAALTGFGSAPAVSPQFTVSTIAQAPGQPCPPYQVATYLAANTVCDGDWNVIGFSIFPTYPSEFNDPSQPTGYSLASCWAVTASPSYKSGYAAPSASQWRTILTTGPNLPTAQQVLAAWQEVFGDLPPSGKMKIELQWVDPLSGAPGPQMTKTLSWAQGTNKGVAKPQGEWPLPSFNVSATGLGIIAPGDTSVTFTVAAGYNYTGALTFSLSPATYIGTGTPPGADKLPPGLTGAFDNPVINFVNGVPDHDTVTLTLTAIAGTQQFNGAIDVEATDTVVTFGTYLTLSIVGVVTPQPPTNYLSMFPVTTEIYTPLSSTTALAFDLFNSGPEDMAVSMLTTNTDPDYTIEYGQGGPATATATPTTITFALATGAYTNSLIGQYLTSAGYAPAGYNVTDAPILSNTGTTVTVASTNNPAAMTTAGIAAVIDIGLTVPAGTLANPGLASVLAFVEVGTMYTMPTPQIQVVASAGKNTTYSIIGTDSNPSNGFQMSPLLTYINQPVPGSTTVTLTFSNTNPSAITATLSSGYPGNGVTVTPASSSVTIPAAAGAVPGTTTVNVTITATAEADLTQNPAYVQAIAGSYSQIVSIWFTDTQYGPLYINVAPALIAPPRGTNQTITVTVYNESAQAATVTLSLPYTPTGFTLTLGSSTLSLAAGSTTAPATATTTLTVTVSGSAPPVMFPVPVNANATGYAETGFVFITLYTP